MSIRGMVSKLVDVEVVEDQPMPADNEVVNMEVKHMMEFTETGLKQLITRAVSREFPHFVATEIIFKVEDMRDAKDNPTGVQSINCAVTGNLVRK